MQNNKALQKIPQFRVTHLELIDTNWFGYNILKAKCCIFALMFFFFLHHIFACCFYRQTKEGVRVDAEQVDFRDKLKTKM